MCHDDKGDIVLARIWEKTLKSSFPSLSAKLCLFQSSPEASEAIGISSRAEKC